MFTKNFSLEPYLVLIQAFLHNLYTCNFSLSHILQHKLKQLFLLELP